MPSIIVFCFADTAIILLSACVEYNVTSPLPTIAEQVAWLIILDVICDQESRTYIVFVVNVAGMLFAHADIYCTVMLAGSQVLLARLVVYADHEEKYR